MAEMCFHCRGSVRRFVLLSCHPGWLASKIAKSHTCQLQWASLSCNWVALTALARHCSRHFHSTSCMQFLCSYASSVWAHFQFDQLLLNPCYLLTLILEGRISLPTVCFSVYPCSTLTRKRKNTTSKVRVKGNHIRMAKQVLDQTVICWDQSVSQSVSGTLDRPRVVAPSKTCGHVRRWPSIVLDLLHPRWRFNSGLMSGLPPVRASTARRSAEWAGVASGSRRTWPKMESRLRQTRIAKPSSPVWLVTEAFVTKWNQRDIWGVNAKIALAHIFAKMAFTKCQDQTRQVTVARGVGSRTYEP